MSARPGSVIGPVGERLTLDNLPPPNPRRWTAVRKAEVVAAVRGGLLTFDEACTRYSLDIEELTSWQRALQRSGMAGLRVTRLQHYRDPIRTPGPLLTAQERIEFLTKRMPIERLRGISMTRSMKQRLVLSQAPQVLSEDRERRVAEEVDSQELPDA